MTQNEIITIIFSAGALIVSLATLYLTYFYKRARLVGVLVQSRYEQLGKYDIEIEYALSNTGNVQLILKTSELLLGKTAGSV